MVEIEFNFNQMITNIQAKLDVPFQDVINKFMQKSLLEPGSVNFLTNGKVINPNESVESHMSNLNKQNKKLKIFVTMSVNDEQNKEEVIVKSKDIICPQCKEPCRIRIENYKIKLYECTYGHKTEDIKLKDFDKIQSINESQIICNNCKFKNKGNCPSGEFYRCLNCKLNLCLLCKPNHDRRHNIIKYDHRNYICQIHNEHLIKYCIQCKKNICFACEGHDNHECEDFIKPNIEEKKKILNELKINVDEIKKHLKEVIDNLNGFMSYINKYYEINNNILENYNIKKRNYQVLKNLNEINNIKEIIEIIKNINNNNNIKNKISNILDVYNNMNKGRMNIMTTIYNVKNQNKIKIFDENFVKNNKNNCYLKINNIKQELSDYFEIKNKEQKKFEIKLYEINTITNMNCMFYECSSLISLPDISKWDTKNVTSMSGMFYGCSSLTSLSDISKWDTKNVTNMNSMFSGCRSLTSLSDISNWDTKNVTIMGCMFYDCNSLTSLPDISKWDTKKVTSMSCMFYGCSSLKSLPDISKWDTKNVTYMSCLFYGCSSLRSLPDIFKWKLNKNLKRENMFDGLDKKIIPKKLMVV